MKIISTTQNSREWVAWRGRGLGASDAPTVMGVSPWATPFELWTYKTGLCTPPEPHPAAVAAMRRGHELEPAARALVEKQTGMSFPSISAEHDEHPFIRASFDGLSVDGTVLLEIKCPGKEDHGKALKGKVPDKYYPQLQQQFLVSGAKRGYYFSWDGKSDTGVVLEVFPDEIYMHKLKDALIAFWGRVQMQMPPETSKSDMSKLLTRLSADSARLVNTVKALELAVG